MPWWGWLLLGFFLLGSALMVVDVAFYLVFIGVAAILTGLVVLAGFGLEPSVQWILFSVLAIVSMVVFRRRLYEKLRGSAKDYGDGLSGDLIRLQSTLVAGGSCRQNYRGSTWTVTNRGTRDIIAGSEVPISAMEGTTIIVIG